MTKVELPLSLKQVLFGNKHTWNKQWPISIFLERDSSNKIKDKALKQLKALKHNELFDNKLHIYLKPTDSPMPRFYSQP